MATRRFELHRTEDITGVSGTGIVAEGVAFTDGTVALRWTSDWPTSVVFHDRGIEAVQHIHGHGGRTAIVWLDDEPTIHELIERSSLGTPEAAAARARAPEHAVQDIMRRLRLLEATARGPA